MRLDEEEERGNQQSREIELMKQQVEGLNSQIFVLSSIANRNPDPI